jgi:hypothetical protein
MCLGKLISSVAKTVGSNSCGTDAYCTCQSFRDLKIAEMISHSRTSVMPFTARVRLTQASNVITEEVRIADTLQEAAVGRVDGPEADRREISRSRQLVCEPHK